MKVCYGKCVCVCVCVCVYVCVCVRVYMCVAFSYSKQLLQFLYTIFHRSSLFLVFPSQIGGSDTSLVPPLDCCISKYISAPSASFSPSVIFFRRSVLLSLVR